MKKRDKLHRSDIVMIITDQQTWKQNWDPKWGNSPDNFPAMTKLLKNGLAFNNAHCNTCTCTSSRTTLFTGTFPAQHGATQVLAFDDPYNEQNPPKGYTQAMQGQLKNNMQNMFKMMESAGYEVVYKGKWHVSKPSTFINKKGIGPKKPDINHLYWTEEDVDHLEKNYGIKGWNYPDAGDDANIFNFGGGDVKKGGFNNDGRFVDGKGQSAWYGLKLPGKTIKQTKLKKIKESTVNYIKNYKKRKPLFLVVSLVNPHDVLSYPGNETVSSKNGTPRNPPLYQLGGYVDDDFKDIKVKLPKTWNEELDTKPKIQSVWKTMMQGVGEISTREVAQNYVKFYAYLTSLVDLEIDKVLGALKNNKRTKDALIIRISDHGDMAMSHGMLRQKMYNAYQQTINVPMIFSHPSFKESRTTEAMSGLIDIMPTMAEIAGVKDKDYKFHGKSLLPILTGKEETVQDHIHFTFDDNYTQSAEPQKMGACHIRCVVQQKEGETWKYAVYFDPDYGLEFEYELYDLTNDPDEQYNLGYEDLDKVLAPLKLGKVKTKIKKSSIKKKRKQMHVLLTKVMIEKGTMPDTLIWPKA